MQVLDYSAGLPGAAAIAAAGYAGAVRYIGFPANRKCTNRDELADFTEHGLGMALVFEETAGQWRNGYAQGFKDYQIGRAHADGIGFPASRPIYMAIDQDVVSSADFNSVTEYLRGARDAAGGDPGLIGVYGEHDVCLRAASWRGEAGDRLCLWFWQCRAWSGTPIKWFEPRHLFQNVEQVTVGGVQCDTNDVSQQDWGQHFVEEDMQLSDRMDNWWGQDVSLEDVFRYVDYRTAQAAELSASNGVKLDALLGRENGADVDEAELARQLLLQGLGSQLGRMPRDQFDLLVKSVNDEQDRRARGRANVNIPPAETGL